MRVRTTWCGIRRAAPVLVGAAVIAAAGTSGATVWADDPPIDARPAVEHATEAATVPPIRTTILDVVVRNLLHDATRDVLYAAVDGTSPRYANRVIAVDPDTGEIVGETNVGTQPNALAISADGGELYVGTDGSGSVRQFHLPDLTPGWIYPIEMGRLGIQTAEDIEVSPVDPDLVAVTVREGNNHRHVVLLDGGVPLPDRYEPHPSVNVVEFAPDGDHLWGANNWSSSYDFTRIAVTATGLTKIDSVSGLVDNAYSDIDTADGLVYTTSGRIIDPRGVTTALVDTLTPPRASRGVATDASADRVYFVSDVSRGVTITAHDTGTRDQVGEWLIDGAEQSGRRLRALGDDRVAFTAGGHPIAAGATLVIVDLTPEPGPDPDPTPDPDPDPTPDPDPDPVPTPDPAEPSLDSFGEYTALTPTRVLDTRIGLGHSGAIGAGATIDLQLAGVAGIPRTGVAAVVMNVTAVLPTRPGFLTVYPKGIPIPTISNLNFDANDVVANLVTMPVGSDGAVSIHNPFGSVDVLADIAGFYADSDGPDGLRFTPIANTRIMDSRTGLGGRSGALTPRTEVELQVAGVGGVPGTARAVALNVTVTGPSAGSFVSVYPADVLRPIVSNLNVAPGSTNANQAIVGLSLAGAVKLYNEAGSVHVIVDVVGYYSDDADIPGDDRGRFVPIDPERLIDTRLDSPFDGSGALPPDTVLYTGDEGEIASAYVLNVTATGTIGNGFVTAYPFAPDAATPESSTLNYRSGQTVPNHAITMTGPYLGFYNAGGTAHVVVDVFGAFT